MDCVYQEKCSGLGLGQTHFETRPDLVMGQLYGPLNKNQSFHGIFLFLSKSLFGSVIAGAFQITFRAKMHINDVFSFFKNHFWHQHIKTIQKIQTILNFSKKKNSNFLGTRVEPRSQTLPNYLPPQASLSWHHKHSFKSSIFSFFLFFSILSSFSI